MSNLAIKISNKQTNKALQLLFLYFSVVTSLFGQNVTDNYTTTGAQTWVVPFGVTSITIQSWGAGGGGGGTHSGFWGLNVRAGGGGGGAFSSVTYTVNPGDVLDIFVGNGGVGGNSDNDGSTGQTSSVSLNGTIICSADGGKGGRYDKSPGYLGSATGRGGDSGVGFLYKGGNADVSGGSNGAPGGGGAGTSSAGGNATNSVAGLGGSLYGGNGGGPKTTFGNGNPGFAPGGGGSGSKQEGSGFSTTSNTAQGGNGARGEVRITYCAPLPKPTNIIGHLLPCEGSSTIYSVPNNPLATGYTWTLPNGWSGTSTTDSIEITVDNVNGQILVASINECGASEPQFLNISIGAEPSQPDLIIGELAPCQGTVQNYSVTSDTNAVSYVWSLPSDWAGASTSNLIGAMTGSEAGTISVIAVNECGSSIAQTLQIATIPIPVQPSIISGISATCEGNNLTYSVQNDTLVDTYIWTLPTNWIGASDSNSIEVVSGSNGGTISVVAQNSCGNSPIRLLNVTSLNAPLQPSVITGQNTICEGTTATYQVVIDPTITTYTWSIPSSWSGTSNTNELNVVIGDTSGTITVIAENSCGTSPARTFDVVVNQINSGVQIVDGTLNAIQNGAVYQWVDCASGAPIIGATGQSYSPTQNGEYNVLIFTQAGCSIASDCIVINNLSVDNESLQSKITIFPNPASEKVVISNLSDLSKINILDMTGKVIYSTTSNSKISIDLVDFKVGVYLINIKSNSGSVTKKLVVNH